MLRLRGFSLDGAPLAGLKTGTYVYVDRPAGQHRSSWQTEAVLSRRHAVSISRLVRARRLFFAARMSDRKNAVIANASTGVLGYGLTLGDDCGLQEPGADGFHRAGRNGGADRRIAELKLAQ